MLRSGLFRTWLIKKKKVGKQDLQAARRVNCCIDELMRLLTATLDCASLIILNMIFLGIAPLGLPCAANMHLPCHA